MRTITAFLLLAAAIGAAWTISPAQARDYRYCLYERYGEDCSFNTYAQCQASASGRAAYCNLNRRFAVAQQPVRRRRVQ
ncbi:MAG: DUF3551 domain-containing protein [Xanthobacteraceae bacterium]|nr:DUF3551 domain-containing protein [Xanthobacteraceae bacterium]